MVLENTLESPLDCKEIQPVYPKGDQSWIDQFIGRTDAEAETPVLCHLMQSWLIGKDPDAGRDCRQEEKGMTEDEMVGWHHWLDGHGFESTPGVGDGEGGLVCCDSWGHRESDMPERRNWTELNCMSGACCCLVAQSCSALCDPVDCSLCQAPLSMEFPRQEDWIGFPFPFPRDVPSPGIEPTSLALAGRFFTTEPRGRPIRH